MLDFIKKHPYLTFLITAAFTNLFVFTFFPLEIVAALAITAAVFATYGVSMLIVQFFNWAFFPTEEVPARQHRADLAADNIYIKGIDSEGEKELSPEELKELESLTVKLKSLIPALTEDPITYTTFTNPIIANDLRTYSNTEQSYRGLIRLKVPSAFSGTPFVNVSFPFYHARLNELCDKLSKPHNTAKRTLQNLLALAICPVTKEIMKEPQIAHLVYTDQRRISHTFVLVCDRKALDILPPCINLAKEDLYREQEQELKNDKGEQERKTVKVRYQTVERRREWGELKDITTDDVIGPKLQQALEAASIRRETDPKLAWEAAYAQAQKDFPSLNPAPSQYSSTPQSFHYASKATKGYYDPGASASASYRWEK